MLFFRPFWWQFRTSVFGSQTSDILWTYYFGHNTSEIGRFRNSDFEWTSDRLLTSDFRLSTSDFKFWALKLDFGCRLRQKTADFRLGFWISSDFVHQISLWTLDISFQTSDCGFRTCFRRRILAFNVRLRTDVKLRTQKLRQFICHTTKTNLHM